MEVREELSNAKPSPSGLIITHKSDAGYRGLTPLLPKASEGGVVAFSKMFQGRHSEGFRRGRPPRLRRLRRLRGIFLVAQPPLLGKPSQGGALHNGSGKVHKRHKTEHKNTKERFLRQLFCASCVSFCVFVYRSPSVVQSRKEGNKPPGVQHAFGARPSFGGRGFTMIARANAISRSACDVRSCRYASCKKSRKTCCNEGDILRESPRLKRPQEGSA